MDDKFLIGIKPRDYQKAIVEKCKEKNCLVVLPTGIGKTLIALMLTIDRMQKFPLEKIVFLAPTRPLAEQHFKYFQKHLPELFAQRELFTGKIDAEKRKKIWQNADIIFSTPQCIGNDIKKDLYNLENVSLLIEDEAHRCVKNYSYTYIAKKYSEQAKNPRILGLTASPGADKKAIKTICENLSIEDVEIRTRESEDVKDYLQEVEFKAIKIELPKKFQEIKNLLNIIYIKKVEELKNRKLLFGPPNKITLIEAQNRIMRSIASGNKNGNLFGGASACAQAIKVSHAIELIETQTLYTLNNYFQNLFQQSVQNKSRAVKNLVANPDFNKAYILLKELLAENLEHPKLLELKDLVENRIKENSKAKIIIFSQYRDSVTKISKELNSMPNISAKVFVGQAKKQSGKGDIDTGLSQKEQQSIIKEFSAREFNVLCATSVHPEEYIILKNRERVLIKKIGEFVDSFIKENLNETTSRKIYGWKALSSDGKNTFFKPITHIHKHLTENNIVQLKLSSGFDCFVTKNHSLFSFNSENNFIPTIPKLNKFVSISLKCPNIEYTSEIDIIKEIHENCSKEDYKTLFGSLSGLTQAKIRILKTDLYILNNLTSERNITELSNLSKRDYSTVMRCLNRLKEQGFIEQKRENKNYRNISNITKIGIEYLKFLKWFFKNVRYSKGKYKFNLISKNQEKFREFFEQNINVKYGKTKFSRFIEINEELAKFLGFYVSEGSVRKTKYTSDLFLAARNKDMQKMMKESIENGLNLKTRQNWKGIAIDSQIVYYLIKYVFKAGIGAYNKEVPELIFTSPSKIKWAFLKAYFLGDGHLGKDKIVLTTVSRKLVTGLVLLLRMLNIKKITIYKQNNIYRLNIFESLPFAKIKEKNKKNGHAYYSLIPTAIKNNKTFELYKNYFNNKGIKSIKSRKNGKWEEDICFDYIKKIKELNPPKYVYDLSVKDTENFIGGTGLFCLHNSIGEEGLDIPEVNAVIFYEPVPSAIRKIQRAGRTARLMPGELIVLVTKGTKDEANYWSAHHKEKRMHKAISEIKQDFENEKINYIEKNNQKTLF